MGSRLLFRKYHGNAAEVKDLVISLERARGELKQVFTYHFT